MKGLIRFLIIATGVLLLIAPTTQASIIGYFDKSGGGGSNSIFNTVGFSLVYGDDDSGTLPLDESSRIFGGLSVDVSDIGNEYFATSGFSNFVAYLTDGSDEYLNFSYHFGGASGAYVDLENQWFGTSPDFNGFTVAAIGLKINSLTFATPGEDPNRDGIWTDSTYNVRLNVYDEDPRSVPEPSTLLLLGSGMVGLVGFGRKRPMRIQ